ncbi:hypothetical protein ON010_g7699 [Phytophthora cinnamomi]|nr:hypothetical protein ON010_g7699 [Phytophthora cinnamomi]
MQKPYAALCSASDGIERLEYVYYSTRKFGPPSSEDRVFDAGSPFAVNHVSPSQALLYGVLVPSGTWSLPPYREGQVLKSDSSVDLFFTSRFTSTAADPPPKTKSNPIRHGRAVSNRQSPRQGAGARLQDPHRDRLRARKPTQLPEAGEEESTQIQLRPSNTAGVLALPPGRCSGPAGCVRHYAQAQLPPPPESAPVPVDAGAGAAASPSWGQHEDLHHLPDLDHQRSVANLSPTTDDGAFPDGSIPAPGQTLGVAAAPAAESAASQAPVPVHFGHPDLRQR